MAISTAEATEQRVREIFRTLFEDRDFSRSDEFWSGDTVDHFLALGLSVRGADQLRRFFKELFAAVPDWTMEIERVVATADHAVVQWRGTGTHDGAAWQGIEPTGRRIEIRGCDVVGFDAGGRIAENTIYYDGASFARQIGMLPAQHSTADRAMVSAFNAATKARTRFNRAREARTVSSIG
jgi:steroid delta-isomerase-like uncharacterized protein